MQDLNGGDDDETYFYCHFLGDCYVRNVSMGGSYHWPALGHVPTLGHVLNKVAVGYVELE